MSDDWVRFVGYTAATFNGNLGGVTGANAKCRAQFPDSVFCTTTDFGLTEPDQSVAPGSPAPWIDGSRDASGRRQGTGCSTWSTASSASVGTTLLPTGTTQSEYCNTVRPIACCAIPIKRRVRGVTTATFTGNLGGITGANSKCRAEYPGSYYCTTTDFSAAELSAGPSSPAPWIDGSRDASGRRQGTGCSTWTTASSASVGTTLLPTGNTQSEYCNTARPILCCE